MKVLLIDPPFKNFAGIYSLYFPLGLTYLAGAVNKAGHECRILDMDAAEAKDGSLNFSREYEKYGNYVTALNAPDHPTWQLMRQLVKNYNPDIIGITAMTTKFGSVIQTAKFCRETLPTIPIVVGGAQASTMPELVASIPEVDFVLRGESDEAMPDLLQTLSKKADLHQVAGLTWKNNGKIIHNPDREFAKNLDALAVPDRQSLLNPEHYSSEDMGIMLTSRGCPFRCSYCFHMWEKKVRYRSIPAIIEEILQVHREFKTTQFSFKDDSFTVRKKHVLELCEALQTLPFKITFNCTTRVDIIDNDLIVAMKKAGLSQISIGIESGSSRILKETDKDITHAQILEAAALFRKHNIFWTGYFMIGLPTETEEDILKTIKFLRVANPCYGGIGVYNPFPRTRLFDQGVAMGLLDPNPPLEHFLNTNPKDLFFKDPHKRMAQIEHQRFQELAEMASNEFHQHNSRLFNMARRGFARQKAYMNDPALLWLDMTRAASFLGFDKLIK